MVSAADLCRNENQVLCNNTGKCIYDTWLCDGEWDCQDGEDEQNCTATGNIINKKIDILFYRGIFEIQYAGCPRRPINPIIEMFVLYSSYIRVNVDFVLYFLEKRTVNSII